MSRWFVASVIALVLSCFGFVAVAHGAVETAAQCEIASMQLEAIATHEAPSGEAIDPVEPSAVHDESTPDCTEIATGGFRPVMAVFVSHPVPRPAMSTPASPFLAHPKRPPRSAAVLL